MTFTARTTTYNGIEMRSRNEARFAAALDAHELAWKYEPMCYASGFVQYLPDFEVETTAGPLFVEVKPTRPYLKQLLGRMKAIRSSVPDAMLAVTCPTWHGYMVTDRAGIITAAHWASWSQNGREHIGALAVGDVAFCAGFEDGRNSFVGQRIDLPGDEWIEFLEFNWQWGDDGE